MEKENAKFVLVKVGTKYFRMASADGLPEGTEVITDESLGGMNKVQLGELYGAIAGTSPKTFKDRAVAVESITYQVEKMTVTEKLPEPGQATAEPSAAPAKAGATNVKKSAPAPKVASSIELVIPENAEALVAKLPPQARDIILSATVYAEEIGSKVMSEKGLVDFLATDRSKLKTTQTPARIFQYYRKRLFDDGLLKGVGSSQQAAAAAGTATPEPSQGDGQPTQPEAEGSGVEEPSHSTPSEVEEPVEAEV